MSDQTATRDASHSPRAHSCVRHQPGMRACYQHGCRCRACTDAATAWARRFQHARSQGRSLTVPIEPLRAHLDRLRTLGMTQREVAEASGVSQGTIRNIVEGRVRRCSHVTASRLIGVRDRTIAGHGEVPAVGTVRRLRALACIGYDSLDLAPLLGCSAAYVRTLRRGQYRTVHATTHDTVRAAWDSLQSTPNPAGRRAIGFARRHQWAPPAAWDDGYGPHGIDNPDAEPIGVPGITGRAALTAARIEDARDLWELGESPGRVAARLGVTQEALMRTLVRHAPELAAAFTYDRKVS